MLTIISLEIFLYTHLQKDRLLTLLKFKKSSKTLKFITSSNRYKTISFQVYLPSMRFKSTGTSILQVKFNKKLQPIGNITIIRSKIFSK